MTPETPALRVAIVGGGFSGTLVAVHLLRGERPVHIDLIDLRAAGRGLAYSTVWDAHLLNVPAVRMSAFGSQPRHFIQWLRRNGKPDAAPDSFISRKMYGAYLQDLLQQTARDSGGRSRFRQHFTEASGYSYRGTHARLALANGAGVEADKVVLALGNPSPRQIGPSLPGYFASPWEPGALDEPGTSRDILLIGAGLTAVDAFLALEAQGFRGRVHVVSRRGKLPHAHTHYRPLSEPFHPDAFAGARALLRAIRERARAVQSTGGDWRAVVDALRPLTNDLWQALTPPEQRRILRHAKTWWDIHRHRMAPEIGQSIASARTRGQLRVHAGRLLALHRSEEELHAEIVERGERAILELDVQRAINCTGPDEDYRRIPNRFVRSLHEGGRIRPAPLGRGIVTDVHGAVVDAAGAPSDWLFTLGPPRLGTLWETTAVPELRRQAEALASYLEATVYEPVEEAVELYLAAGI